MAVSMVSDPESEQELAESHHDLMLKNDSDHLESYTPGTCQYVPVRTDLYQPVL